MVAPIIRSPGQPVQTALNSPQPFRIRADERVLFVGRTGCGKTTLADRLIRRLGYRTAVIDPKGLWNFPGYQEVQSYSRDPRILRQLFRPKDRRDPWPSASGFMEDVWTSGIPTVVYIDELYGVCNKYKWPDILGDLVRWGRQWGYGCWFATQRPRDVPLFTLTEAEHYFVFDLKYKEDRKRIANDVGDAAEQRIWQRYAFFYSNNELDQPILVKQE